MAKRTYQHHLRIQFLLTSLIPIFVLLILFGLFTYFSSEYNVYMNSKNAVEEVNQVMRKIYSDFNTFVFELEENNEVNDFLDGNASSNIIYSKYYGFMSESQIDSELFIYDHLGELRFSSINQDKLDIQVSIVNTLMMSRFIDSDIEMSTGNFIFSNYFNDTSTHVVIGKIGQLETLGYAIYYVNASEINQLIDDTPINYVIITDQYNNIISTSNNQFYNSTNKFIQKNNSVITLRNGLDYKVNVSQNKLYNYKVYTLIYAPNFWQEYLTSFILVLFSSFLLILLVLRLARNMALSNSKSIDELLITVNKIKEGDLNARAELKTNDEFEILANQFNTMVIALNDSMNRNIELNSLKTQAEKKQLIAQFNPHFLFNTLETIRYLILTKPNEASDLILRTTQLLRYSLHQADELVLLKHDLEYTRLYCEIQKTRFAEKLEYTLDIHDEILSQKVPKLLIQPIIENSIIHGFKQRNNLNVSVKGYFEDDRLVIYIIDNGFGIGNDKLKEIKRMITDKNNNSNHQGIYNVYKRLYLVYEDKLEFDIQSNENGTTIKVSFPRG